MIEYFKICNHCRESCVLLILNSVTILKTAFSFKKMSFFTIFNKANDSEKKTQQNIPYVRIVVE